MFIFYTLNGTILSLLTNYEIYRGLFQIILFSQSPLISILGGSSFIEQSNILLSLIPIVVYSNADIDKSIILNDNKGKAGIYQWTHLESGKIYIGSATDLSVRLKGYNNKNYLSKVKGNSYIYNAILEHDYSLFSLSILEFIDITNLSQGEARKLILSREQYYLDESFTRGDSSYNLLKIAGSSLGYRHSYDSLKKISQPRPNFSPSKDHKEAIRLANANKILTLETKSKISTTLSHPIYVYTPNLLFLVKYPAITIAKLKLKISPTTIKKYCISGEIYKNKYRFSYTPFSDNKNQ